MLTMENSKKDNRLLKIIKIKLKNLNQINKIYLNLLPKTLKLSKSRAKTKTLIRILENFKLFPAPNNIWKKGPKEHLWQKECKLIRTHFNRLWFSSRSQKKKNDKKKLIKTFLKFLIKNSNKNSIFIKLFLSQLIENL